MQIKIRDSFLGTHQWSGCPHKEVSFLKNEHAHDFIIEVQCNVSHSDRDLEFIKLRIFLKQFMKKKYKSKYEIIRFGEMSCEMISEDITKAFYK